MTALYSTQKYDDFHNLYKKCSKNGKHGYVLLQDLYITLNYEFLGLYETDHIKISGYMLYIKRGFWWNGSSIVPDTKACMYASCIHDAVCEAISYVYKTKQITEDQAQSILKKANKEYKTCCVNNGMWYLRALIRYRGLYRFSWKYITL